MNDRSKRISDLIIRSGKTYLELEKITGIKKSSLQRYASGVTEKIPLTAIEKLAKAFSVPTTYLMGWEEEQKKNDIQADIILKMRTDSTFLSVVENLYKLDKDKLETINQMLNTLFK